MLGTIGLSYWVISSELEAQRYGYKYISTDSLSRPPTSNPHGAGIWVKTFAYYCLLIHFLVFVFPIRSCMAVFTITRSLRKVARSRALKDIKFSHRRRGSSTSLSSSETLTSSRDLGSTSSSEAGDLDVEMYAEADIAPDRIIHAIIIPNYKEENDTLRETLEVLASHPQARNTYDVSLWSLYPATDHFFSNLRSQVMLGMEQREHNAEAKAIQLTDEFAKKFRSIDFAIHPADIPNEVAGKGSNVAWAARKLSEKYSVNQRKDVIITGIDGKSRSRNWTVGGACRIGEW